MKKQKQFHFIYMFIMCFFICAFCACCSDDDFKPAIEKIDNGKLTVLGKKLENPYSVKNMKIVYETLKSSETNGRVKEGTNIEIRTTHLYVRFLPPNYNIYDSLDRDSTLYLLDRPIDFEVEISGDYYHDPAIPDTLPTFNIQQFQ